MVTDDSPNDEVMILCKQYQSKFSLVYQKNSPAKGSPANWNEGIRLAKGEWIKIMHDDDWFASDRALQHYASIINSSDKIDFIFSAYNDYENNEYKKTNSINSLILKRITKNPLYLFRSNYVGNPSVIMVKKNLNYLYDEKLKWVVDFEFYMRCIEVMKLHYIPEVLINVGYNSEQITKEVFRNIKVEIPENIYMLNKLGIPILKNMIVFDYYWRLFRNLNIRSLDTVYLNLDVNVLPKPIIMMLQFQFKIPLRLLKFGVFSKILMTIAYIRNKVEYI